jgi:phage gp36-like protein
MYASEADLTSAAGASTYAQLMKLAGDQAPTRGADAIARAVAEIDSYLCRQFALPLAQVPAVLRSVCCDIAIYRLWVPAPPEDVVRRYSDAVAWLRRVADGTVGLGLAGDYKPPVEAKRRIGSVALVI